MNALIAESGMEMLSLIRLQGCLASRFCPSSFPWNYAKTLNDPVMTATVEHNRLIDVGQKNNLSLDRILSDQSRNQVRD